MAVKSGASKPDIGTTDAFVASLLAAESIGYSASASGTYIVDSLDRQNLADLLKSDLNVTSGDHSRHSFAQDSLTLRLQLFPDPELWK